MSGTGSLNIFIIFNSLIIPPWRRAADRRFFFFSEFWVFNLRGILQQVYRGEVWKRG